MDFSGANSDDPFRRGALKRSDTLELERRPDERRGSGGKLFNLTVYRHIKTHRFTYVESAFKINGRLDGMDLVYGRM